MIYFLVEMFAQLSSQVCKLQMQVVTVTQAKLFFRICKIRQEVTYNN